MKKQTIKFKTWILFTEFGTKSVPYVLDSTNLDVSDEELSLNVQEQIYGTIMRGNTSK